MAARKPRIEYKWRVRPVVGHKDGGVAEVTWSLYGANGEFMCGSGSEGFTDKYDAERAVRRVIELFRGESYLLLSHSIRIIGPGRKPA